MLDDNVCGSVGFAEESVGEFFPNDPQFSRFLASIVETAGSIPDFIDSCKSEMWRGTH